MASRFVVNGAGIEQFKRSPQLLRAMWRKADHVRVIVTPMTPVDTGRMRQSWETGSEIRGGTAVGLIWNTAKNPRTGFRYPAAVELGNSRVRAQRVLGRALSIAERG